MKTDSLISAGTEILVIELKRNCKIYIIHPQIKFTAAILPVERVLNNLDVTFPSINSTASRDENLMAITYTVCTS